MRYRRFLQPCQVSTVSEPSGWYMDWKSRQCTGGQADYTPPKTNMTGWKMKRTMNQKEMNHLPTIRFQGNFTCSRYYPYMIPSLKLTAKAPENGCLEYDRFLLRWPIFRGELLLLGRATWLARKSTMNESMYFLLNMGILQPVMLVLRGVISNLLSQ